MNFYISDMHYGHANILRLCNRPFSDVYEMNKALIQNWNSAVTPYDTVYIVGDVAWNVTEAIEFMHNCRGKKVLIVGNHDKKL